MNRIGCGCENWASLDAFGAKVGGHHESCPNAPAAKANAASHIWILGYRVNEYDQEEHPYFLGAYFRKPTVTQLQQDHKLPKEDADLCVSVGGGRIGVNHKWYFLFKLKEGAKK